MSARRRNIDANTGLYTVENGDYLDDGESPHSKVLLALKTKLGSAAADPLLGSKIHTVLTTAPADRGLAAAYARSALSRLVDAGEISNVEIEIEASSAVPGRLLISVGYTTRQGLRTSVDFTSGT